MLLTIYSLSVRSAAEYCSVVWHNNLTQGQTYAREQLQIVSLKIILGSDGLRKDDGHFDYEKALTLCDLKSLFSRREARTVSFGKKCIQHPSLSKIFPLNQTIFEDPHTVRSRELYQVNRAKTAAYNNSAIPAIQRRLNQIYNHSPPLV